MDTENELKLPSSSTDLTQKGFAKYPTQLKSTTKALILS